MGIKLRIAMLGHKRILSREGGVEIVAEELAVRMVEKEHEVRQESFLASLGGVWYTPLKIQDLQGLKDESQK